jgi:hypothetical protein
MVERNVQLTQQYGIGPQGILNPDTGGPYYGLYLTTFFPFVDGIFSVQVE